MKNIKLVSGVGIATFVVFALPAQAHTGIALESPLSLGVGGIVKSVQSERVSADIENQLEIDSKTNASVDGVLESELGVEEEQKKNSSDADTLKADQKSKYEIVVNADAKLKTNKKGVAVIAPIQITSKEDLEVFASNAELQHQSVAKVQVASSDTEQAEIKVVYRHKGKLLGFIPVTIKSTTSVEADNEAEMNIKSRIAWWSFLVAGEQYDKEKIESRIKNNARIKAYLNAHLTDKNKAEIVDIIIAEITAEAKASAEATVVTR